MKLLNIFFYNKVSFKSLFSLPPTPVFSPHLLCLTVKAPTKDKLEREDENQPILLKH